MSVKLLVGKAGVEHTEKHDLESFFYVLLYICTMYNGHTHVGDIDDPSHPFGTWINTATTYNIAASRNMAFGGFHSMDETFSHVRPYFTPLIPLLQKFCDAIFRLEGQNQRSLSSPKGTHASVLHVLRECFNELPNEESISANKSDKLIDTEGYLTTAIPTQSFSSTRQGATTREVAGSNADLVGEGERRISTYGSDSGWGGEETSENRGDKLRHSTRLLKKCSSKSTASQDAGPSKRCRNVGE
jgi:hypothetical protein